MRVRDFLKTIGHVVYWGIQAGVLWLLFTLVTRYSQNQQSPLQPAAIPPPVAEEPSPPPPLEPHQPARLLDLRAADRLFEERRWNEALEAYEQIASVAARGVRLTAAYRAALCMEALGDYPAAERRYSELRAVVARPLPASVFLISQARCWLRMGLLDRSLQAAADVLIQQSADLSGHDVLHEARYLLALAVTAPDWAGVAGEAPVLVGHRPHRVDPDWIPTYAKSWIQPVLFTGEEPATTTPVGEQLEVARIAADITDVRINVYRRHTPVLNLLEEIAEKAGFTIAVEPEAREVLKQENTRAHVSGLLLSHLLSYLSARYRLAWQAEEGKVTIRSCATLDEGSRLAWQCNLAERLIREANVWLPEHPALTIAFCRLGVLRQTLGDARGAEEAYTAGIREASDRSATLACHYNLGLLAVLEQDFSRATTHLYSVVDAAPGTELAAKAHLLLGMLHLVRGSTPNGVAECRRALLASVRPSQRALAAVWTACAYLLDKNPAAALQVLEEHERELQAGEPAVAARFLRAYARFLAEGNNESLKSDLLAAAIAAADSTMLGTPGCYLVGDALRRLGLDDLMKDVYERRVGDLMPGVLREEILGRLVDYYQERGNFEAALQHLLARGSQADARSLLATRIRQIELQIANGQCALAIEQCRQVLREVHEPEQIRIVLGLMGRAYERLGDYRRAALCYGGRVPLE